MMVTAIDPLDQTWELDAPCYRVHLYGPNGFSSDEYELSCVDIDAVLAWAQLHRADRPFVVYVCVPNDDDSGFGLVRLAGYDPCDPKAQGSTPAAIPQPATLVIGDESFTAIADPEQPGAWQLTWDTGSNPGYGYTTRRSDHQWATPADLVPGAQGFLAEIDPKTDYLKD